MRVLLDECVTRYLKRDLEGHEVDTVEEAGFKGLDAVSEPSAERGTGTFCFEYKAK